MKISGMLKKILAILTIVTILLNVFAVESHAWALQDLIDNFRSWIKGAFEDILLGLSGEVDFYRDHNLRKSLCIYYR